MTSFGGWNHLLCIKEPVYWELTLEALSKFEVDRSGWGTVSSDIQFKLLGGPCHLSYTQFSLLMGLYNADLTTIT